MMAETVSQIEAEPSAYPDAPEGLSEAAQQVSNEMLWQRIEAYVAWRFSVREVTWVVEGNGHWTTPLTPATISAVEEWTGTEWVSSSFTEGPYGACLPNDGPYRVIAMVGAGSVPEAVSEAYRRLAEYLAPGQPDNMLFGRPGASSHSGSVGDLTETYDRSPAWIAKAMQYSGAGDLLRPYRRA